MKPITITDVRVLDLRFPTSRESIGSDAVNKDPDYSAAYCILETDAEIEGHGLTFTLGRGTDLCVSALKYLADFVRGRTLDSLTSDLNGLYLQLAGDTQFRWLGPEKGVIHLACGALINAVWDLYAKSEGKPVWQLLAEMSPEQIVAAIDFRYIEDALSPVEALEILRRRVLHAQDSQGLLPGVAAVQQCVGVVLPERVTSTIAFGSSVHAPQIPRGR